MNQIILSTRLLMPTPRKDYIIRRDLFTKLDAVSDKKLTVIKGPPGSGKTTLLTSYIKENSCTARWISLDKECNHLSLFWGYTAEALSNLLDTSLEYSTGFLQMDAKQNIQECLKVLINSLPQSKEIWLVLDNFHLLDNPDLLTSLEYFIANIPPNLHIILLTRNNPKLYLAGYALQGELLSIEDQELSMQEEESLQFLTQTLALSLPKSQQVELIRLSGGWLGGLQLLAAAPGATDGSDKSRLSAAHTLLHDYITTEIFHSLSQEEQDFLVQSCAATYFNQAVAEALIPDIAYTSILSGLLERNLMLQCIDEEQGLFQYHDLFRSYLLERFETLDPEKKEMIYRKLSAIFHTLKDEAESLRHLFLLQDYDLAMSRILQLPDSPLYYSYIARVPISKALQNFDFAFQKCFYHYYIYDFSVCDALCNSAVSYAKADKRYEAFAGFPQIYGNLTLALRDTLVSPQNLHELEMHALTRALILIKNTVFLFYQDRYIDALDAVNKSLVYEKICDHTPIRYFALTLNIQICEEMGLLNRAFSAQTQILQLLQKNKMLRQLHAPTFSLTIAGLYMKQMRLEEAERELEDCKATIAERGGQLQQSYTYNRIEYLFLTGAAEEAVPLLHNLMALETYPDSLPLSPLLKHLYCSGHMSAAMQDQYLSLYETTPANRRSLNSRLLYARIQNGKGQPQLAIAELETVLQIARKQEVPSKIIEATLQRIAILFAEAGNLRRLLDLYKEALYYACENNLRLPFFIEATTVAALHQQYSDKFLPELSKQEKAFHMDIIKLCIPKATCLLSHREQEILQAMADGLTNNEIARQLYISLPTVKTHISNIFRKLEVKGRVNALEKARQLGILPN